MGIRNEDVGDGGAQNYDFADVTNYNAGTRNLAKYIHHKLTAYNPVANDGAWGTALDNAELPAFQNVNVNTPQAKYAAGLLLSHLRSIKANSAGGVNAQLNGGGRN